MGKTNTQIDAVSAQMKANAKAARAEIDTLNKNTLDAIATEQQRASNAVSKFASDDAARQKSALDFMEAQLKIAGEAVDKKFGAAYEKLAADRSDAEVSLAASVDSLNDALAKQAALADSRFEKTVSDIGAARKEAADAVAELRSDFGSDLIATTALVKRIETDLNDRTAVVSGEASPTRPSRLLSTVVSRRRRSALRSSPTSVSPSPRRPAASSVSSWMRTSRLPLLRSLPSPPSSRVTSTRPVPRTPTTVARWPRT